MFGVGAATLIYVATGATDMQFNLKTLPLFGQWAMDRPHPWNDQIQPEPGVCTVRFQAI
jgi:hypothetical protein